MTVVSVVSDLHLEFEPCELPGGDILLLCGDAFVAGDLLDTNHSLDSALDRKKYRHFCATELRKYWRTLLVLGNHENWNSYIDRTPELIRQMLADYAPNATLLNNEWVEIDGVRFIGSTLWATYGYGTGAQTRYQFRTKDFKKIGLKDYETGRDRPLFVSDAAAMHEKAVGFIRDASDVDIPCVVMTHYSPTYYAVDRQRFPDMHDDEAYCSNQHDLIVDRPRIKLWFHGHVHNRHRTRVGDATIAANPRGYAGYERIAETFEPMALDFDLSTFEFVS